MAASTLLPFQKKIINDTVDPASSDLVLLARGLGLRKIICSMLQIYHSKQNLILLVNARPEEEAGMGEELGIMGVRRPGLRIVGYEMGKRERCELYRKGGLLSVTSRILIVDMLQRDLPVELITGLLVLHAEKVTPSSLEAFIVRLYRESNTDGFLKAFSDQPEFFTSGMFPLKTVIKELQIRKVAIYPRFQEDINRDLGRRKADIVELHQPLNQSMQEIHDAIVQCISATLADLKRSNAALDLEDLNVENAYFASFDSLVRRQLDPVWHNVGAKTKQLANDLGTLRRLLSYLLSYDAFTFHSYLELILAANSNPAGMKQNYSPWLQSDAANVIFKNAKRRCYIQNSQPSAATQEERQAEDDWAALNEVEGGENTRTNSTRGEAEGWEPWMPKGMEPVLEELPKWSLLAEILKEIETDMIARPSNPLEPGSNAVLVMATDNRTCALLREFLSTLHLSPHSPGRHMMLRRLQNYLWWKPNLFAGTNTSAGNGDRAGVSQGKEKLPELSEAMKKKDAARAAASLNRRRVRGGSTAAATGGDRSKGKEREGAGKEVLGGISELEMEADKIAEFLTTQKPPQPGITTAGGQGSSTASTSVFPEGALMNFATDFDQATFNEHYGLLTPDQIVVVRPYGDDGDDQLLAELRPRWIVMFDPNQNFIRRIEVYRSSNPGLAVRVYFMMHHATSEEHKYLVGLRREKDAFEKLIREKATMFITIDVRNPEPRTSNRIVDALSSRNASGQVISNEPQKVIVDLREFRSSLPSLLHKERLQVVPATLTVGDYILTPDICVERKSVPDLVQSFASGRLYSQCELMSVHYKQPFLLIEFEENKSFSLQTIAETKIGKSAKYTSAPQKTAATSDRIFENTIQSKLVLLTLAFPRLRIIWSSSPYQTSKIFADLKKKMPEPDVQRAIAIGAEEEEAEAGEINALAEDLLRSLPGVTTKNYRYVMSKVGSIKEMCGMSLKEMQDLLGIGPGKKCYQFLHHGLII
ncbi:hypothetical protein BOTBODRAFT_164970 [Botryobasidium botryosum FD-172 SS1]|uniref:ERCC4 domain-containing protein n=1 Tax=Botryobasidium botryosum (strain FD-172 SS1) TaxID=930990 RepID=A0A067MBS5_BOTB1|nr:hypothetical protein BOTBODRAFT_164970 [Botryobasidium botryosum FD-172 SS1]